jgi:hypothetical protein
MTAYLLTEFCDPKMGVIFYVLQGMWWAGETVQIDRACAALVEKDKREQAERAAMKLKVGV